MTTTQTLSPVLPRTSNSTDDRTHRALLRGQAAVVRALLDELDRTVPGSGAEQRATSQLVEDLVRLGCRLLEVGLAMARALDR